MYESLRFEMIPRSLLFSAVRLAVKLIHRDSVILRQWNVRGTIPVRGSAELVQKFNKRRIKFRDPCLESVDSAGMSVGGRLEI